MANPLRWVERNVVISWEDRNMQLLRPTSDLPCGIPSSSVAQQIVDKTPNFSIFSWETAQRGSFFDSGCLRGEVHYKVIQRQHCGRG